MTWPTRRPDYLPVAVWEHARTLRDQAGADPRALARLIGPEMATTWLRLTGSGVRDPDAWRLILEAFHNSRAGAGWDPDARKAQPYLRELTRQVYQAAAELGNALENAREIADRHALSLPAEFREIQERDPVEILERLALAAGEHDPAPDHPEGAAAMTSKSGPGAEWARTFDIRWRLYTLPLVPAARLTPSDMARVGSAVLGYTLSRESVAKALKDAPEPLPSGPAAPVRTET